MEQRIRDRYTGTIMQEAQRRYGIGKDEMQALHAAESFIYEFERGSERHILRIGHSLRRSEALIEAEIEWIDHLAAGGVSVAQAISSETGKRVEAIDDGQGGQFLATAFVKAQGRPLDEAWTPTLYAAFGRSLGSMHALAEHYRPSRSARKRPSWDDDIMDAVGRYLPASEGVAKERYQALCTHLRTLPADGRCYGLIHFDAHGGNCVVDDAGLITLFDFDDCSYSWYANDIAIALSHIAMAAPDAPAVTQAFMPPFLRGYLTAYPLERRWLRELPVFLKMAEIFVYAVIHRDHDVGNITDPWCAQFMRDRKHRIEHDVPTIDFDFESLSAHP